VVKDSNNNKIEVRTLDVVIIMEVGYCGHCYWAMTWQLDSLS